MIPEQVPGAVSSGEEDAAAMAAAPPGLESGVGEVGKTHNYSLRPTHLKPYKESVGNTKNFLHNLRRKWQHDNTNNFLRSLQRKVFAASCEAVSS